MPKQPSDRPAHRLRSKPGKSSKRIQRQRTPDCDIEPSAMQVIATSKLCERLERLRGARKSPAPSRRLTVPINGGRKTAPPFHTHAKTTVKYSPAPGGVVGKGGAHKTKIQKNSGYSHTLLVSQTASHGEVEIAPTCSRCRTLNIGRADR